jgi:hypothetical protein
MGAPQQRAFSTAKFDCVVAYAILLVGCAGHRITPTTALDGAVAAPANPELPLKHAPAPTTAAITARDLMTRLYGFADDSMMGRQAGSEGYRKATAYIAGEFRRMGLVPAGDAGTYFQAVPLMRVGVGDDVAFGVDEHELAPGADFLLRPGSGTPPVLDGARTIYGGPASDSAQWISDEAATGKIVLFTVPPSPGGTRQLVRIGPFLQRFPHAAGIGIAELDLASPAILSAFNNTATVPDVPDAPPAPYLILLSPAAADSLFGGPLDSARVGMPGRTARARVSIRRVPVEARNVVAVLPGSDPARRAQYLAIGAHNDHIGMAGQPVDHDSIRAYNLALKERGLGPAHGFGPSQQPDSQVKVNVDSVRRLRPARPDSVYNGADDDGSGTVALLELAQAMASAKQRPRRSILFISHTAEETGLLGSRWYTDHPTVPRDSIVAYLNMDLFGGGGAERVTAERPAYLQVVGSRRLSTELGELVDRTNGDQPQPLALDYALDAPGHRSRKYCRSDHVSYARIGIPVVFFSTGYHVDYHQVTDEPQYINYHHLERVTRFVHDVALRVVDLNHRVVVDKPQPDPRAPCVQ